jgi:modulator of FtsH protease HflC
MKPIYGLIAIALFSLCFFSFHIVPEGKQAVLLQFGRVIPPARVDAGFYFKLPWREARLMEKRILNWDGRPSEIPTREKKYIIVDTAARYRITDPILFIESLVDINQAQNRLQTWINNATREVIASHNLVETVRNTNEIIDKQSLLLDQGAEVDGQIDPQILDAIAEEEISGEVEPISVGREMLTQKIKEKALESMAQYGLELVDIHLKRVALEETVETEVYKRMITERERIAEKIRSIGRREQAKIRGRINRDLQEIESNAYRKVQELKGTAEAEAIDIYAQAMRQDPEFYKFLRSLEAMRIGLGHDSSLILSSESDILRMLRQAPR